MPKVAIVGNCQAQALEAIFIMHTDWEIIRIPAVFKLTDADIEETHKILNQVDIIFAQRITDDYKLEYMRTSYIQKNFNNVMTWPNIYFSGYFPDVQYIYQPNIGKVVGPLDDYHLRFIHYYHHIGRTVEQCAYLYRSEALSESYPDPITDSLNELAKREEGIDLPISPYLETVVRERKCFFTVNHPANSVLFEMADIFMRAHGEKFRAPAFHPYALARVNIPIYPQILRNNKLDRLSEGSFVGIGRYNPNIKLEDAPPKVYENWEELITHFYRFYDVVFDKQPPGEV